MDFIERENGISRFAESLVYATVDMIPSLLIDQLQVEGYIVSFCSAENDYVKTNGLLSQWRGYGANGGYAIEFDVNELNNALLQEIDDYRLEASLFPCVYSDDEKIEHHFAEDLGILAKYVVNDMLAPRDESGFGGCSRNELLEMVNSFLRCSSRFKHKAFKEEKEVRIVISLIDDLDDGNNKRKNRKFLERKGIFVPYIMLFEDIEKLPIRKIIVGPHREKEHRAEALRVFLNNKGYKYIDVAVSDIPFV